VKFIWRDRMYETVEQSDLSWQDMELLEEATGFTSSELGDEKVAGKARVIAALSWMSVRALDDSVTFAEFFGSKIGEWEPQAEGEQEQTVPPPPVDPDDPLDGSAGSTSGTSGTSI